MHSGGRAIDAPTPLHAGAAPSLDLLSALMGGHGGFGQSMGRGLYSSTSQLNLGRF